MSAHLDRHPLTQRFARTLREADRNPWDWWEPPQPVSKPRPYRHSFFTRLAQWMREQFN